MKLKYVLIITVIFLASNTVLSQINGTTNYLPKFTSASTIGNSIFYELNGKVGIGTMSPQAILSINDGAVRTNGATGLIVMGANSLGTTVGSYQYPFEVLSTAGNGLRLQTAAYRRDAGSGWNGTGFRIQYAVDNSMTNGSEAYFELGGRSDYLGYLSLGTGGLDRLYINFSGNVGIGTTSPTGLLHVQNSTGGNNYAYFYNNVGSTNPNYTAGLAIGWNKSNYAGEVNLIMQKGAGSTGGLKFQDWDGTTLSDLVMITRSGNAGIGTTSPTAKLHISGNGGWASAIRIDNTTGRNWSMYAYGNSFMINDETATLNRITLDQNGNVGIGTASPKTLLALAKTASYTEAIGSNNNPAIRIANTNSANFYEKSELQFSIGNHPDIATAAITALYTEWSTPSYVGSDLLFSTKTALGSLTEKMRITASGNVGIGTTTTGNCRLAVEGMIGAREVQVVASGWPDYVFDDAFKLTDLDDVEHSIKTDKHLPGIPSKEEVAKDGMRLGEIQTKLLQKVEELTLYVIELKKENESLKKRVAAIETKAVDN